MSRIAPFTLGLAIPLSLLSQAAWAELTPAEVWGDWRSYLEGMGYEITATEATSGDDLTLSDISMSMDMPEAEGSMNMTIGSMAFNQNSDGTVAVVLPGTMPITITGQSDSDEAFTMTVNYTQTGHSMTASGSPDKMKYTYTAGTFSVDLAQIEVGDDAIGAQDLRMNFSGTNLNTTTNMTIGDVRTYEQAGNVDDIVYDIFAQNPDGEPGQAAVRGTVSGIKLEAAGTIPIDAMDGSDISSMMLAGFDMRGNLAYEMGTSNIDVEDPENGNFTVSTSSKGGDFGVEFGGDGLVYDLSQRGTNISVLAQDLPFPIEMKMAGSGFFLKMPVLASDDPQDFGLGLTLTDFTMSDIIWNILDPSAQLPRDPATILLDLGGQVRLLVDYLDPEAVEDMAEAPGELISVNLGELLVDAVGARLSGAGGVEFDGAADGLVPGAGNPVGTVNFGLIGGNALLDNLVAMGIIPSDQAMGARMMMGLFAVVGAEPDSLESRIEFTQDGQILANGQRIR